MKSRYWGAYRAYVTVLWLFYRHKFTNTIPYCFYLKEIYFFEHEKKICDTFWQKDLSKLDSESKQLDQFRVRTWKSWPTFSSSNPSPSLPYVTMGDSKQSQGCDIVSRLLAVDKFFIPPKRELFVVVEALFSVSQSLLFHFWFCYQHGDVRCKDGERAAILLSRLENSKRILKTLKVNVDA